MKILNKMESWVNKLDTKLFGKKEENYQPYAGKCFIHILFVALIAGIILAITQIFTTGKDTEETVETIAGLVILVIMIRDVRRGLKSVTGIGKKIGYVFFNLFITMIAFQLAMYAIFLLMFLIVGWIILAIIFPDKGGNLYEVHHADGTIEKVKSTQGLMGEEIQNMALSIPMIRNTKNKKDMKRYGFTPIPLFILSLLTLSADSAWPPSIRKTGIPVP